MEPENTVKRGCRPVALVMDEFFGDRVRDLALQMPVWIVSSKHNKEAVIRIAPTLGLPNRITLLSLFEQESQAATLTRALYDIDQHHGPDTFKVAPYDELVVIGITAEHLSSAAMRNIGIQSVQRTEDGFIAEVRQ